MDWGIDDFIEWRDIPGWAGIYEVSEYGDIRSIERVITRIDGAHGTTVRVPGRILKPGPHEGGYDHVNLWRNNKAHSVLAHRQVALAFLGEPPSPDLFACHIDGNSANSHYTNLRWATPLSNSQDRRGHGTAWWESCRRGHKLVAPNLYRAGRDRTVCKACKAGYAKARQHGGDMEQLIAESYLKIMGEASVCANSTP